MPPKLLPGEKRKRSLVTVEMDSFDAGIFAPERWEAHKKANPTETVMEQDYVVSTRRLDGHWTHKVKIDGVEVVLPHKVYETLKRQVETIITEERSERGKTQAEKRKIKAEEKNREIPGLYMCEYCGHESDEACGTCGKFICVRCGRHSGEPDDCRDWK